MKKVLLCSLGIVFLVCFNSCKSTTEIVITEDVVTNEDSVTSTDNDIEKVNEQAKGQSVAQGGTELTEAEGGSRTDPIIGMPNPFYDCDSLEAAAEIAGFSMILPSEEDLPEWVNKTLYRATKTNLLEIIFKGEEELREIRLRKAITDKKDMSGDYNSYEKEEEIQLGDKTVTARMNGEIIYLIIWQDEGYSYSARVSDGLDKAGFTKLLNIVK